MNKRIELNRHLLPSSAQPKSSLQVPTSSYMRNNFNISESLNESRSNLTNSFIPKDHGTNIFEDKDEQRMERDKKSLQRKIDYHFNKERLNKILNRNFDSYKKKSRFGAYANKKHKESNQTEFESEYYNVKDQIIHFN